MMKYSSLTAIGALSLMMSVPALAIDRGDPSAGEQLADELCISCHAVDGSQSNPEWPKLSGQYADYLFRSLQQYQDGTRDNAVMQGQVEDLSTQDLRDLASYYSRLDGDLYVPRKR